MTREEAVNLYNSEFWKGKTDREVAEFQLNEDRLCMPMTVFQNALSVVLDRPVFTHEFADREALIKEFKEITP